ncbi:MAG: DUF1835 domain-containing protein [Pyrinomonadaceae bacterium]
MIVHVLPGDSIVEEFQKTGIMGDIIVCREALIAGDVNAPSLPEFWEQRARFILSEYGDDEIEYHEKVADELARLVDVPQGAEVNLWFEYEAFCSVNLWFCLWLLSETEKAIYRVEPAILPEESRWDGFGKMDANDLKQCYDARLQMTRAEIALGAALWEAYRRQDSERLSELGQSTSDAFPYLDEVCAAIIDMQSRPVEVIGQIMSEGKTGLQQVFPEFKRRAGVYGYGDLQVQKILDQISSS